MTVLKLVLSTEVREWLVVLGWVNYLDENSRSGFSKGPSSKY